MQNKQLVLVCPGFSWAQHWTLPALANSSVPDKLRWPATNLKLKQEAREDNNVRLHHTEWYTQMTPCPPPLPQGAAQISARGRSSHWTSSLICFQVCFPLQEVRGHRNSRADQSCIFRELCRQQHCFPSWCFCTGQTNCFSCLGWASECPNGEGSQGSVIQPGCLSKITFLNPSASTSFWILTPGIIKS